MAKLKERFGHWKESRSAWQKAGDIFFWALLVALILPGPRKVVATNLHRVVLQVKSPGMVPETKQTILETTDYQWILSDRKGNRISLQDYRGQVVFINFWATWCPPCVAELPEIHRAYEKYGGSVAFLLVSSQEPPVVEAFLEERGYDLPVVYATQPVPEAFAHSAIPTTYILSRDGRIAVKKTGAMNWDSKGTVRIFEQLLR
jgi:thiol-disulfide isomerase/thioredoxin